MLVTIDILQLLSVWHQIDYIRRTGEHLPPVWPPHLPQIVRDEQGRITIDTGIVVSEKPPTPPPSTGSSDGKVVPINAANHTS